MVKGGYTHRRSLATTVDELEFTPFRLEPQMGDHFEAALAFSKRRDK